MKSPRCRAAGCSLAVVVTRDPCQGTASAPSVGPVRLALICPPKRGRNGGQISVLLLLDHPGDLGKPDFQCPTTRAQAAAHQRLQAAAPGIPRLNSTSRPGAIPPAASAATSVASGGSRRIRPDTDTKDPGRSWFRRAHGGGSGQRNRERPRLDRLDEVGRWWLSRGAGGDPTLVHAVQPSLEGGIRRRAQSRSARKQLLQSIKPRQRLRQRAGQARVMCELQ